MMYVILVVVAVVGTLAFVWPNKVTCSTKTSTPMHSPPLNARKTALAKQMVAALKKDHIRLVAFDFDYTVLHVHTFYDGIASRHVPSRNLHNDFADLTLFKCILKACQQAHIHVGIVSFAHTPVIDAYLNAASLTSFFPPGTVRGHDTTRVRGSKKSTMLDNLRRAVVGPSDKAIQPHNTILFDDSPGNLLDAHAHMYKVVHVVRSVLSLMPTKTGLTLSFVRAWLSNRHKYEHNFFSS